MSRHPRSIATSTIWTRAAAGLVRARGGAYAALLIVSLLGLTSSLWHWSSVGRQNAAIAKLQSGEDAGTASASGEVLLARAAFLLDRDRFDEAQSLLDTAKTSAAPPVLSRMLYNQANANVRRAFAAIAASKLDAALPLTRLAKDAYREALRLDPGYWSAKHNYDVAARLMRDFPGYEQDGEEVPPEADVKLWTDLPGVPQGAP